MFFLIEMIRYRLLHEWRQAVRSGARRRLKAVLFFAAPVLSLLIASGYHAILIKSTESFLRAGVARQEGVLGAAFLAAGAFIFLISLSEIMQQVWFAKDREILASAPMDRNAHMAYRCCFAMLRSAPWAVIFLSLPVQAASALPSEGWLSVSGAVLLGAIYWVWLSLAALCPASLVLAISNRMRLGRHPLFVAMHLLQISAIATAFFSWLTPSAWLEFAGGYEFRGLLSLLPHHQMAALLVPNPAGSFSGNALRAVILAATLLGSSLAFLLIARRLWYWETPPDAALDSASRATWIRPRCSGFSTSLSWAIFQKDRKDLFRNPVYRSCLIANFVLLLIGLWVQARNAASSGLLMMTLSLVYVIPLVVSGRTVSLEFPLLELYQLVFPRGYSLLDAKLRAQGTVNILVSLAAAFPFFLLLRPGFQTFSALYFMAATVIFVPVLTALALALGTYFPDLSPGPSVLGMRLKGLLLYSLMAVILYSFLLNRMYMATVLYGVFLILVISPLYLGARRRLDSSMERWAH